MTLRRGPGAVNEDLEIILYCNRLQLAYKDALYSDGDKYVPAITAVKFLEPYLNDIHDVLVLGSGLGSIVRVMHANGSKPKFTLVEQDKVVLKWAMEFFDDADALSINPVCMDAESFMGQNSGRYDFVFIDIFSGLDVPGFVTTEAFLKQCREALAPGGHVVLNYINKEERAWQMANNTFNSVFPGSKAISMGINKILAC